MNVTRNFDLLDRYKALFDKEDALCGKQDGKWVKYSSKDYIDHSWNFAYGLLERGFQRGDRIITVSNNRPEWNFADLGMAMIGVVHVPVFTSLSISEYEYIIVHSGARMILVSDSKLHKFIKPAAEKHLKPADIYSFDIIEGVSNWSRILDSGKQNREKFKAEVEKIKSSISPEDFATLIYTSGTTGKAKGVMLSHKNLVSNFISASSVFNLKPSDNYLSILPLCHVGGRMGNYQTQYSGSSIYYAENMGTIAVNLQEIKADGFDAVPRVIEKFYDVIISKGRKLNGIKKVLFFWAVKLGLRYKPFGGNGWLYEKKLKLADKLIFSKWSNVLDRLCLFCTGWLLWFFHWVNRYRAIQFPCIDKA